MAIAMVMIAVKRPAGDRLMRSLTSIGFAILTILPLALAPSPAASQASDYPNRPVSFIVPFAAGGVTSVFARLIGQKLENKFGKAFVVENRPGGGGITAAYAVARAAPDGYTIMMASSTVMAINVTVR